MKEKKQTIIFIGVAVLVLVGVFILSSALNKSYILEISYDEYTKLKEEKDENYVYTGSITTSIRAELNSLGKEKDTTIYYVNTESLDEEEKKEIDSDSFIILNDGEEKEKYNVNITKVTGEEYLKLIKEDGFHLMFIGSETCGYCTKFKDSIKTAQLFNHFDVYYLDLNTVTDETLYNKIIATEEYLQSNEWGTPTSFLYKDGKNLGVIPGYVTSEELVSFLKEYKAI